ncbi:MAG: HEAT repeat domain-containing protein [Planctomycetota bacterium]
MRYGLSVATTIIGMAVAIVVHGQAPTAGEGGAPASKTKIVVAIVNSIPDDVAEGQAALINSAKEIQDLCKEETHAIIEKAFRDSDSAKFRRKALLILERLNLPESKEFLQGALREEKSGEKKESLPRSSPDKPKEGDESKTKNIAAIVNAMPDDVAAGQPALKNSAEEIQTLCKGETLAVMEKAFKESESPMFRRKILLILQQMNLPEGERFFLGVLRGGRDDQEKELALDFLRDKPTENVIREIALTTVRTVSGRLKNKAHRALAGMVETNREATLKPLLVMATASKTDEADAPLREAAFTVLGRIPDQEVVKFFREALNNLDDDARISAVKALGRCRDAESLPRLAEMLLSDSNPDVRCEAARAVGLARKESHVPQLIEALSDDDARVRQAALQSLQKMTGQSFQYRSEVWSLWWKQQQERQKQLIEMLNSDSEEAILRAISLLSKEHLGGKEFTKRIEDLTHSDSKKICYAALRALGNLGQESSISVLLDTLGANDSAALIEALRSLSRMTSQKEKIAAQIAGLATDYDDAVAAAACQTLGDLGCAESVPVLISATNNLEGKPLLAATRALGKVGSNNPKAAEALIRLVTDRDTSVATEACNALAEAKSREAIPVLIDLLGGTERSVAPAAHLALTRITGKRLPPKQDAWAEWWQTTENK